MKSTRRGLGSKAAAIGVAGTNSQSTLKTQVNPLSVSNSTSGLNVLSDSPSVPPEVSRLIYAQVNFPAQQEIVSDLAGSLVAALSFISDQQQEDGSIGGFYVSQWALMALKKLDPIYYQMLPSINQVRTKLLEYTVNRSHAYLAGEDDVLLTRTSTATEGTRILLSATSDEIGADLFNSVWEKMVRLAGKKRQANDSFTVWRSCMLILMQRQGWTNQAIFKDLVNDLESFRKPDGGWSEGGYPNSFVEHSAAAMMALGKVNDSFFEQRRDQGTGGFRALGNTLSVEATSWTVFALGTNARSTEFLLRAQQTDGSISTFQADNPAPKIWPTVYAISALNGGGF